MKSCIYKSLSAPVWLAVGISMLVVGCVAPPKDEPRIAALETHTLGLSETPLPQVSEGWWKAFGDPQLNRLVDDALANNPSLSEALLRVRAAQAQAVVTGAPLRPGVSLDGEEVRQRLSKNYIYPPAEAGFGIAGGDMAWIGQLGLNLSWDLDFWGRQSELLKQAKVNIVAAQLDTASARLALSGAMAQSYVELYRAYALADIATQNEQQRETLLRLTRNRVKVGLDTQVELKTAEAALPQVRNARLQAENQRDTAIHNLAALAGHGADAYATINRPQLTVDAILPLPNQLTLDVLSRRPDVLAAKARVESATAGRAAAKAAFYPDINLKAFAGFQAVGFDKLLNSDSVIYGAGPALHLPLFDSQRLKGAYLGSTVELDGAVASYNDTLLKAVRDVADQLSRNDSLNQQLVQARQSLAAIESAYQLAQHRYEAGLSSQLTVLNAESNLLNARRDLISLNAQLLITRVTLLLVSGGSFDPTSISASPTLSGTQPVADQPGA